MRLLNPDVFFPSGAKRNEGTTKMFQLLNPPHPDLVSASGRYFVISLSSADTNCAEEKEKVTKEVVLAVLSLFRLNLSEVWLSEVWRIAIPR